MDRLLLRPAEAAETIGIGRSKVYELLASGDLPSIRVGGSIRVPVTALHAWDRAPTRGARRGDPVSCNARDRTPLVTWAQRHEG